MKRTSCTIISVFTFSLILISSVNAQDAVKISPRKTVEDLPSVYPSSIYFMDSESSSPYNWPHDASVILGIKTADTNFRHVQLLYYRDGSKIAIRGKNGTLDQWLPWSYISNENWVEENFVKKDSNGHVGIGTSSTTAKLTVAGSGKFEEVIVEETIGADFVFGPDYRLPDLSDLESFITTNHHLPDIPTAGQMIEEGVKVGDLQMKLLQKIEELTLYMIEQQKAIDNLKSENKELKQIIKTGDKK